jgi:dTMP kinase
VTLEGPEGSGKTTQAERLARAASGAGLDVVLTREPGGTSLGEEIRSLLLRDGGAAIDARAEALLFNAARAQLVSERIEPALARGSLVVCARFADSTVAYQGYGRGLDVAELRALERIATGGRLPDLTLLLDLPVGVGLSRKGADETTRFEGLDLDFHERVRAGFLALGAAEPRRIVVIDARRSPDDVEAAVVAAVARIPGLEAVTPRTSAMIPNHARDA